MADAHGSGPCDSNIMRVQVPFPAYITHFDSSRCVFYCNFSTDSRMIFVSLVIILL